MMDASLKSPALNTALMSLQNKGTGVVLESGKINLKDMRGIEAAAKDFEAVFAAQMFSHMFDSIPVDPMFGGGSGEEMFRSLLVNEYGKKIAEGPGLGISDEIRNMMIQMQQYEEVQS